MSEGESGDRRTLEKTGPFISSLQPLAEWPQETQPFRL